MTERIKENIVLMNSSLPYLCLANSYLGRSNTLHAHDFTELILVTQGRLTMRIEDKLIAGQTSDLFIIPSRQAHLQTEIPMAGVIYVGVNNIPDILSTEFRKISLAGDFFIHKWMNDIVELRLRVHDSNSVLKIASGLLLSIINRIVQLEQSQIDRNWIHPKVRKAIQMIESNAVPQLTINDITSSLDISESYFNTLFRKFTGKSPLQYQLDFKMEIAKRYLAEPHNSVKQTAFFCGFHDINYFIRLFRKKFNTTPGKWRENIRNRNRTSNFIDDVRI